MRSYVALRLSRRILAPHSGRGSSLVAASGGQGGIGGLRFPAPHCAHTRPVFRAAARQPHSSRAARDLRGPSLDSPLPLETPPLRYGEVAARASRYAAGAGSIGSFAATKRRCFGGGEGWPLRGRRGDDSGFAAAQRSSPGERERALRPSRALIEPGGVYAGFAAISSEGSLPPGEEIASYRERMAGRAACRPTNERVQNSPK